MASHGMPTFFGGKKRLLIDLQHSILDKHFDNTVFTVSRSKSVFNLLRLLILRGGSIRYLYVLK